MQSPQFAEAFEKLSSRGFEVREANYDHQAFGSWWIEFSQTSGRRQRLVWDGKEASLILATERESKKPIPFEEIRAMSYEDGLARYYRCRADQWEDEWVGHGTDQSIESALENLA